MFSETIREKMNEKTLENACLELVTINGRPFKLMDVSGVRKIMNLLLEGMRTKFTVNAENIREKIGEKASDVRYRIKMELECKFVSVKADVATCRDRSTLGVNLQFISDGKIQLHTLAMKELKEHHTGFYLKTVLKKSLNNMELRAIKSTASQRITVPNMLKCVRLFSEEDVIERTHNVEQPSCSSWQSDAEEPSCDEDDSATVNHLNVKVFLSDFTSSHTSTAQAGNV